MRQHIQMVALVSLIFKMCTSQTILCHNFIVTFVTTHFQFLFACSVQFCDTILVLSNLYEDQMSKVHRLGSDYPPHLPNYHQQQLMQDAQIIKIPNMYQISNTKLSPVANTAGYTKYQIITGKSLKPLLMGRKFSWGRFHNHNMRHICTFAKIT